MAETEEVEAEAWLPTPDEGESLARGRSRRRAAVVRERLVKAFDDLRSKTVQGCINTANRHLRALHTHIKRMDEIDDADGSDNDEEDDGADGSDDEADAEADAEAEEEEDSDL